MTIGFLFWLLMILAVVLGFVFNRPSPTPWPYAPFANLLLIFVLIFLLGWGVFGPPLVGPGAPMGR
jgi:hypothetical protein